MLLAVNVGNSNIRFGVFADTRLRQAFVLPNPQADAWVAWKRRLAVKLRGAGKAGAWEGVMAATVVPDLRPRLDEVLRTLTGVKVNWVTPLTPMPVKNAYHPPRSLGVDRLLNAVAATAEFGAPVIVVDTGTAIHVDVVDARGVFLGGAIMPGLALALRSLSEGTALLPAITLSQPESLLGRSTRAGLLAGVVGGTAGAVAALVAGMRQIVGAETPVVGTGGGLEKGVLRLPDVSCVRPHLALWALHSLWQNGRVPGLKAKIQ